MFPETRPTVVFLPPSLILSAIFFAITLTVFVIGDRKHYKFDVKVECASHSLTDDKLSLIGAWSGHVTHYKIFGLQSYHWNG